MATAGEWLAQHKLVPGHGEFDDRFYADLEKALEEEFRRRDKERRTLSDHIALQVIQASMSSGLQQENETLKQRIAQLEAASNPVEHHPGNHEIELSNRVEHQNFKAVSVEKYSVLAKKYALSVQNAQEYESAIKHLQDVCHKLKDRVRQWEEYKAHKDHKARQASDQLRTQTPGSRPTTPATAAGLLSARVTGLRNVRRNSDGPTTPLFTADRSQALEPSYNLQDLQSLALLEDATSNTTTHGGEQVLRADHADVHETRSDMKVEIPPELQDIRHDSLENRNPPAGEETLGSQVMSADARITSSQSTEDDMISCKTQQRQIILEQDADEPIVVSARQVGRVRRSDKQSAAVPYPPTLPQDVSTISIKQESLTSSSPVNLAAYKRPFMRTTTMDLDTPGISADTPRKRMRYVRDLASTGTAPRFDPARSIVHTTGVHLLDDSGKVVKTDLTPVPPNFAATSSSTRLFEEQEVENRSAVTKSHSSLSTKAVSHTTHALSPISPNRRALPHTSSSSDRQRERRGGARGAKVVHLLSEDGDEYLRASSRSRTPRSKSPSRQVESSKRLQDLLEGGGPQRKEALSAMPTSSTGTLVNEPPAKASKAPPKQPKPQANLDHQTQPTEHTSDPPSPTIKREPMPDFNPSRTHAIQHTHSNEDADTPLRARPISDLTLDDFRLNPNYIGQHTSLDVIRSRSLRNCLPGCTQPCCTRTFRALVEAGAAPPLPTGIASSSQTPLPDDTYPDTPAAAAAAAAPATNLTPSDTRLLQHHLGASYSHPYILSLSASELHETLLQARTRLLAERHGRHKRVWERARSPPGFWRADMPSTQEEAEDRGEAERFVRRRVRERWEDARRGGGRWVFRDE